MPSPIEALQSAGYSTDEISAWSAERRQVLKNGGFADNEIDAYFTGGVVAPTTIPPAFHDRIAAGEEAGKREGGLLQTVPQFADMIMTPEGRGKLWAAAKEHPFGVVASWLPTLGQGPVAVASEVAKAFMTRDGKLLTAAEQLAEPITSAGKFAAGKLDLNTDEGMDQALGLGTLIGLGRFSKINKTGKTSGLAVANGDQIARVEKAPTGEVFDQTIGGLPDSQSFVDAATVIANPVPEAARAPLRITVRPDMAVQEKLLKLYQELGRLPAEVAHDAQTDPVILQRMLSKDPRDLPYGGIPRTAEADRFLQEMADKYGAETDMAAWSDAERSTYSRLVDKKMARDWTFALENEFTEEGQADRAADYVLRDEEGSVRVRARFLIEGKKATLEDINLLGNAEDDLPTEQARNLLGPAILRRMLRNFRDENPEVTNIIANRVSGARTGGKYDVMAEHGIDLALPSGGGKPPLPPEPPASPPPPPTGSFEAAQNKVLDKISVGERGRGGYSWSRFYTDMIDDLHPLKAISQDAYETARLTRGQFGKAGYFLEQGTFDFRTYKDNGKPLREILEPVRDDLNGLRAYLASRRALEVEASGRKSGFDLDAAQQVVDEGSKTYAKVAINLVSYQNRLLSYLRDSGVISKDSFNAMVDASNAYVPFYRLMGDTAGGGPAGKGFGPGNPVKRLKGSERDIIDPLESIIKNTYAYVSIAERNAAGIKLVDALKEQGLEARKVTARADAELTQYLKDMGIADPEVLADFIKEAAPEKGDTIGAFRDGVREEVVVDDPDLVKAFRGLDRENMGMMVKILSVPAKALRAGAVLTPDFMARNLIRDFLTAFINTGKGVFTPLDTAKGLIGVVRRDADYQNWVKAGGANSTFVALDRRYMQESLQQLTADTGLMTRSWNVVTSPLKGLRMLSELFENATRLGEFKALAGATKGEMQSAAFASREVTLDFARMGAKMRSYNMITAFANAQIQGADRVVRAFADRPVNTMAKVAAGITLPSVLLWWANHDDERYRELPDWQKDLFWIIPTDSWQPISAADAGGKPAHLLRQRGDQWEFNNGSIYRIPKPFELGVIFGSGVERALDQLIGDDPEAFRGFTKSVVEAIMPSYIPTAVQPMFEQFANRSTFTDRTLIPAYVEKLLPEYQYTPYTTELSKKLGQMISSFPGMRTAAVGPGNVAGPMARGLTTPILIENYVRAWSGGLGMYVMQAADAGLRKAGVLPDPIKPTDTLADIPFVKAFVVRYPSASTESIQRFHDDYNENKRYLDTWTAKAKEGDVEAMSRIQAAGGPMMFVKLDAINETLSEHSKLVRDIYKYPMPAEEKRQLIDQLYYSMIQIAKSGREATRQAGQVLQ